MEGRQEGETRECEEKEITRRLDEEVFNFFPFDPFAPLNPFAFGFQLSAIKKAVAKHFVLFLP